MNSKRILFIDYLRTIGFLLVFTGHLFIRFWRDQTYISKETFFKPLYFIPIARWSLFFEKYQIDLGIVGVGIFFLITGFLVPLSIKKLSYKYFLFRRFFRIYPIYLFALIITLFSLFISAKMNGVILSYKFIDFLGNFLLIGNFLNIRAFDMVVWTLWIIVNYYVLAGLFYVKKPTSSIWLFLSSLAFLLITFISNFLYKNLAGNEWYFGLLKTFSYSFIYFIFINIGVALNCLYYHYWPLKKFLVSWIALSSLFYLAVLFGETFGFSYYIRIGFSISFILFLFFLLIDRFLKKFSLITFFSSISYPVYLIHRTNGYILLAYLISIKISPRMALILTISLIILVSFLINRLGEKLTSSTTTATPWKS